MDALTSLANSQDNLIRPLGILALDMNDQVRSMLGNLRSFGVLVVARAADLINSESGLQAGDVIHSLNNVPIDSLETLRHKLREIKPGAAIVMQVERGGGLLYLAFDRE